MPLEVIVEPHTDGGGLLQLFFFFLLPLSSHVLKSGRAQWRRVKRVALTLVIQCPFTLSDFSVAAVQELKNERNKLSTRNRCKATPPADELRKRRDQFIVDAVKVEHARSRFYDIIPPYQASDDQNCRKYFQRSDVKKLLKVTLTPRPWSHRCHVI